MGFLIVQLFFRCGTACRKGNRIHSSCCNPVASSNWRRSCGETRQKHRSLPSPAKGPAHGEPGFCYCLNGQTKQPVLGRARSAWFQVGGHRLEVQAGLVLHLLCYCCFPGGVSSPRASCCTYPLGRFKPDLLWLVLAALLTPCSAVHLGCSIRRLWRSWAGLCLGTSLRS